MAKNDCLSEFQSQIAFDQMRLVDYPNIIFLCGGEVQKGSRPKSLRHKILDEIAAKRPELRKKIWLAEEMFDQFDHTTYSDLLTFEKDLANFCSITIVIVESAGSIAELGAFSVLQNVSDNIVVVVEDNHYGQKSFIRQGPIEYIKSSDEHRVLSYKWLNSRKILTNKLFNVFANDLIRDIDELSSSIAKGPKFDPQNSGHVMLLITALIGVGQMLKFEEIEGALRIWNINIKTRRLTQFKSMLLSLSFIEHTRYSSSDYYSKLYSGRCVGWRFTKDAKIRDIERWADKFREYYKSTDHKRFNAMKNLFPRS